MLGSINKVKNRDVPPPLFPHHINNTIFIYYPLLFLPKQVAPVKPIQQRRRADLYCSKYLKPIVVRSSEDLISLDLHMGLTPCTSSSTLSVGDDSMSRLLTGASPFSPTAIRLGSH